jgi:hypothetical protein
LLSRDVASTAANQRDRPQGRGSPVPHSLLRIDWASAHPGARVREAAERRPAHERLRTLAIDKLPEIEELISRATTIRQLLITCAACQCDSLDECQILEESIAAIPERRSGSPPRADVLSSPRD